MTDRLSFKALAAGLRRSLALLCLLLILAPGATHAGEAVVLTAIDAAAKTAGAGETVTLHLTGPTESRLILLRHPDRVAVDLSDTLAAAPDLKPLADGLVDHLRQGLIAEDRYRLVFVLKRPALARLESEETSGGRLLRLELTPSDRKAFDAALLKQGLGETGAAVGVAGARPDRPFTVVIDPGHGGIDNGAISRDGTHEKDINLQMALALRDALASRPNVTVVLTRSDDTYIPLNERAEIGRRNKADLFISLHADSIRYSSLRGATVYTLSDRASDALSSEIADSENAADRFAGPEWHQEEPEVFDILLDLTRRETVGFSERFAAALVDSLDDGGIGLIKNPKRSAGFRVLRAPDVPSVLVEMGYLSNKDDEKLLLDPDWQKKAAGAIADAAMHFLETRSAIAGAGSGSGG